MLSLRPQLTVPLRDASLSLFPWATHTHPSQDTPGHFSTHRPSRSSTPICSTVVCTVGTMRPDHVFCGFSSCGCPCLLVRGDTCGVFIVVGWMGRGDGWVSERMSYSVSPWKTVTGVYLTNWEKCHRRGQGPRRTPGLSAATMLRIWEEAAGSAASIVLDLRSIWSLCSYQSPSPPTPEKHLPFGTQPSPSPSKTEPVSLAVAPSHLPNCFETP